MNKILYIGGIASSPNQVSRIAEVLSAHSGAHVTGMSFSEARRELTVVARLAADSLVITHSAGMIVLRDMTPKEVIAIAPPMPTHVLLLILRTATRTAALLKSRYESEERRRRIRSYHLYGLVEHFVHPLHNGGQMGHIAVFDSACEAVSMVTRGTKVTLCFMDNDLFYLNSSEHHHIEVAKSYGVKVYDNVLGHHDEFLIDPLTVLAQISHV